MQTPVLRGGAVKARSRALTHARSARSAEALTAAEHSSMLACVMADSLRRTKPDDNAQAILSVSVWLPHTPHVDQGQAIWCVYQLACSVATGLVRGTRLSRHGPGRPAAAPRAGLAARP